MIQEDYVSFEVAKLLKEKGFNIPLDSKNWACCMYDEDGNIHWGIYDKNWYPRITPQMAMKWLRNVHGIHIQAWCPVVDIDTNILGVKYNVVISNLKDYCLAFMTNIEDNDYDSYEEAVDAGLEYTLEHLI